MGKTRVVFAAPRDEAFPLPSRNMIMAAPHIARHRTYSGGAVVATELGVVHLPIPWDARTWATVAAGAASSGVGSAIGGIGGAVADKVGEAVADRAQKVMSDPRILRSLADKRSWLMPATGITRVETSTSWMDDKLMISGDVRPGVSARYVAHMESSRAEPLGSIAVEPVQARAGAECIAAVKIAARELLTEAGRTDLLAPDDVALRVGDAWRPMELSDILAAAGIAWAAVNARARDRFAQRLMARYSECAAAEAIVRELLTGDCYRD